MPPLKRCKKCDAAKPATTEFFYGYVSHGRTGLRGMCIECWNKRRAAIYAMINGETPLDPPVDAVPPGFEIREVATEVGADGETNSQWIGARKKGLEVEEIQKAIPIGHILKGVSTLVDGTDGTVRAQWIKTRVGEADKLDLLAQAVQDIAKPFRAASAPMAAPTITRDDLLCVYPMGDPHIGMFAWARECGRDFDLQIAEDQLVVAADHLVNLAPPSKRALVINLGDFFHMDSTRNETSRGHNRLDVDTRWPKVLAVGIRIMRRIIDRALEKHDEVHVVCEIGNHDDHSAIMLALCLANYYEREPRVFIDTSPAKYHWFRFEKVLIGVTHGHGAPITQLGEVMAADRKEDWGETDHRYWYTGHVHQDRVIERRGGVLIESFRTLAPKDDWAAHAGYRSGQDMKLDVVHAKYGRINRHVVGIQQIDAYLGQHP